MDQDTIIHGKIAQKWYWRQVISLTLICFFSIYCFIEVVLGFSQLFGLTQSKHFSRCITGSFSNPGPYGGFLSLCISILAPYAYRNNRTFPCPLFTNIIIRFCVVICISAAILLPATLSRAAFIALYFNITIFIYRLKNKCFTRFTSRRFWLWSILVSAIVVVVSYLFKKESADGHLFIARICVITMLNDGLKGAGSFHFGGAYGETQHDYFKKLILENGTDDLDWSAIPEHIRLIAGCPDNAFNEYLNIGVEYGSIAMIIFTIIILIATTVSIVRNTIWCYGVMTFAIIALFSYPMHLWQFQVLVPILLLACIIDSGNYYVNKNMILHRLFEKSIVIIILIVSIKMSLLKYSEYRLEKETESAWIETERLFEMGCYDLVVENCMSLFDYLQHDSKFLFDYGLSLNMTGDYEKSDSILKLGATLSSDPMFWNVMGDNSLKLGHYRKSEECYKHAFYMVPNRIYPLSLLAKLYHNEGDTIRFIKMADIVNNFIPKIENSNTLSLRSEIINIKNTYYSDTLQINVKNDEK